MWAYLGDDGIYDSSRISKQRGDDRRLGEARKHCAAGGALDEARGDLASVKLFACPQA